MKRPTKFELMRRNRHLLSRVALHREAIDAAYDALDSDQLALMQHAQVLIAEVACNPMPSLEFNRMPVWRPWWKRIFMRSGRASAALPGEQDGR